MFDFVAFDTETTGTSYYNDEIIEIAGVKFVNGKPVAKFESYAKPLKEIPKSATLVHKITNEMVADAPCIDSTLRAFSEFVGDAHLVAHNAPFDVKFISESALKQDVTLPSGIIFDTYQMSKILLSDLLNHRLENVVKHFEIESGVFHRALDDSKYCGMVFMKLLFMLYNAKGSCKVKDILELHKKELLFPEIKSKPKQIALF